jgi:undecaprenyl-diphosphatase
MDIIDSIIIGIVEGITEFLPISSTGHMIVTSSLMGIGEDEFTKLFEVVIQLGAILAVVITYWKKFFAFKQWQFYAKLLIGVVPALLAGWFLKDYIKALMGSNLTVGISLIIGGFVFLFIDKLFKNPKFMDEKEISFTNAFFIGCWQILAMIPGVSRSGATIIGGMQQGLNRPGAAEFSFFLAVPTMCAAAAKDLLDFYKDKGSIKQEEFLLLGIGAAVALVVALFAIKLMVSIVRIYGFKPFGYYRIIAGALIIALVMAGTLSK